MHADDETRADLAVKRETVTPFWWALRTLLKVSGHCQPGEPLALPRVCASTAVCHLFLKALLPMGGALLLH